MAVLQNKHNFVSTKYMRYLLTRVCFQCCVNCTVSAIGSFKCARVGISYWLPRQPITALTQDWMCKSINAGDIRAQNINRAERATTLQTQETLVELADFKRLDIHAEGRSDHLLYTHLANLPPSNSENPKVHHHSMDNTSFLTGKETSCVQKGEHNSCFEYF